MKAERKHEIETNELADTLTQIGDWLQQNMAPIALLVGAAVVGGVAYSLIFAEKAIDTPAGDWNRFIIALSDAQSEKELELLVDSIPDARSPVAVQAKLALASLQLSDASRQQFEDRKAAAAALEKAKKNFEAVETSAHDSYTRNRARMGIGAVLESQNKPDEAQKYYEQVAKSGAADSPMTKLAANDAKRLESKANREFITWFEKQTPVARRNPHANFPFDTNTPLPETKDFSLPGLPPDFNKPLLPGLDIPGKTEAPKDESAKTETPKEEPAKTDAPKDEAPKTETPKADSEKAEPAKTETKTEETKPAEKVEPKADTK